VQVGDDDGLRFGRNCGGNLLDVDRPSAGREIGEDGASTEALDRAKIAGEVVSREDDFVAGLNFQAAEGEFDGDGARGAEPDVRSVG
jgi:hypothetical protein